MLDMLRWLPDGYGGASSYAGDIDAVFRFIYWLTFAIFALVTILMVWFLYQIPLPRRGDTPSDLHAWQHGVGADLDDHPGDCVCWHLVCEQNDLGGHQGPEPSS